MQRRVKRQRAWRGGKVATDGDLGRRHRFLSTRRGGAVCDGALTLEVGKIGAVADAKKPGELDQGDNKFIFGGFAYGDHG